MNRQDRRRLAAHGRRMQLQGWGPWKRLPLVAPDGEPAPEGVTAAWMNHRYLVQVLPHPDGVVQLMVLVNDGGPTRSWADLQRIKNELVGPERVAVEVFPAADDLVDEANVYHLWVLPEGQRLPFGLVRHPAPRGAVSDPAP